MWMYCFVVTCLLIRYADTTTGQNITQQVCHDHTFGTNCSYSCGHCHGNEPCHVTTGECLQGCGAGWRGKRCFYRCPDGTFGENCTFPCGHCRNGLPCDVITGECRDGCQDGWQGRRCVHACNSGRYGYGCALRCGACRGRCDAVSGSCPDGCEEGWLGQYCLQPVPLPEIKSILVRTLTIIGVVVGVVLLLSIAVCTFHCLTLRRRERAGSFSDSGSLHEVHRETASAVILRGVARKSRALSQLYSIFTWGSDFDDKSLQRHPAGKPEPAVLYANGEVTLGLGGVRLSQEVPAPGLGSRDPLYVNSEPVRGKYENWTS